MLNSAELLELSRGGRTGSCVTLAHAWERASLKAGSSQIVTLTKVNQDCSER